MHHLQILNHNTVLASITHSHTHTLTRIAFSLHSQCFCLKGIENVLKGNLSLMPDYSDCIILRLPSDCVKREKFFFTVIFSNLELVHACICRNIYWKISLIRCFLGFVLKFVKFLFLMQPPFWIPSSVSSLTIQLNTRKRNIFLWEKGLFPWNNIFCVSCRPQWWWCLTLQWCCSSFQPSSAWTSTDEKTDVLTFSAASTGVYTHIHIY